MPNLHCLKAYFHGNEVEIHGGYQHHENGCHVEISGRSVTRQSVSIWELSFPDVQTEENIFKNLFGLTPQSALVRDLEKRGTNDICLKFKSISIEETVEKALKKIPTDVKEEIEEDTNCMVLEKVGLE